MFVAAQLCIIIRADLMGECFCRYTWYEYQLLVYNDVGYALGELCSGVTLAGAPLHAANVSAQTINHTAILLNWTTPSESFGVFYLFIFLNIQLCLKVQVNEMKHRPLLVHIQTDFFMRIGLEFPVLTIYTVVTLPQLLPSQAVISSLSLFSSFTLLFLALQDAQGKVELYFLRVDSTQESQTLTFGPSVTSVLISDLQPNTEYTLSLTVSNGPHNITSPEVTCTTADGGEFKETSRSVKKEKIMRNHDGPGLP